jgi:hypothetical protein
MIGKWLSTLTDEALERLVDAPADLWLADDEYTDGKGCGCLAFRAGIGDVSCSHPIFGLSRKWFPGFPGVRRSNGGRYENLCIRFGKSRVVRLIHERGRSILATRALSRMDGPREAVGA